MNLMNNDNVEFLSEDDVIEEDVKQKEVISQEQLKFFHDWFMCFYMEQKETNRKVNKYLRTISTNTTIIAIIMLLPFLVACLYIILVTIGFIAVMY